MHHNISVVLLFVRSQDGSVGKVTGYKLEGWGSVSGKGKKLFLPERPERLGTMQPRIQCARGLFLRG
jgi:hypothetical protein